MLRSIGSDCDKFSGNTSRIIHKQSTKCNIFLTNDYKSTGFTDGKDKVFISRHVPVASDVGQKVCEKDMNAIGCLRFSIGI